MQLSRWIGEQLTILAEAFGENLTTGRMKIYAADLADIGQAQLAIVFRRARHECRFFPKIAELREFAGAGDPNDYAADQAWDWITHYIERHGVDGKSLYRFRNRRPRLREEFSDPPQTVRGEIARDREIRDRRYLARDKFRKEHPEVSYRDDSPKPDIEFTSIPAPPVPLAIEYALRQLAFDSYDGLTRIEAAKDDPAAVGWVRKEFCAAYGRARSLGEQALVARLTVGCEAHAIGEEVKWLQS